MVTFTVDQLIELRSSLSGAIYYSSSGPNFGVAPTMQLEKTTIYDDGFGWEVIASATSGSGLVDLITFHSDDIDVLSGTKPKEDEIIGEFNTNSFLQRIALIESIESWLFDGGYGVLLSEFWQPPESFTLFTYESTKDYLADLLNLMNTIAGNYGLTFKEHPQEANLFGFWRSDLK
jgi:hypothetical protein